MVQTQEASSNSRLNAFLEAKARYQASNAKEVLDSDDLMSDSNTDKILKSLKSFTNGMNGVGIKTGDSLIRKKKEIPVPLPVTDPVVLKTRIKTNKLLEKIDKSILDTALPPIVKIEDAANIANEDTLQAAVSSLNTIKANTSALVKKVGNKFEKLVNTLFTEVNEKDLEDPQEKQKRSWITKTLSNATNILNKTASGTSSLSELFGNIGKILVKEIRIQRKILQNMLQIQLEEYNDHINRSRSLLSRGDSFDFDEFSERSSGIFGKVSQSITNISNYFKQFGEKVENLVNKDPGKWSFLTKAGSFAIIGKFISLMGGIGAFVSTVVGGAAFSSLYAMFRDPKQLGEMIGAFSNLWTKSIVPALKWINEKLVPPLAAAMTALLVAADKLAVAIGTVINKTIIYTIGTLLPDVFSVIGNQINNIYEGFKDIGIGIAGIFGYGPNADKTFFENLDHSFRGLGNSLLNIFDDLITDTLESFRVADIFGIERGNGLVRKTIVFFTETLPDKLGKAFSDAITKITEFSMADLTYEKVKNLFFGILDAIPSWSDIVGRARDEFTGLVKWLFLENPALTMDYKMPDPLNRALGREGEAPTIRILGPRNENKHMLDIISGEPRTVPKTDRIKPAPLDPKVEKMLNKRFQYAEPHPSAHIFAPQTNNNTTINNVSGGRGGRVITGPLSSSPPPNRLDDMIYSGRGGGF